MHRTTTAKTTTRAATAANASSGNAPLTKRAFPTDSTRYGGSLQRTRAGRAGPRPVTVSRTMHVVLRSSKAKGTLSFRHQRNEKKVAEILKKFAWKFSVRVYSVANVGNHLHFHVQFPSRRNYMRFIRAVTAAIAMAVSGTSRWNKKMERFWDYRPFTRIIKSARAFLTLKDYVEVNKWEGLGYSRIEARLLVAKWHDKRYPVHDS